jgi:hypothetical protein
MGTNVLADFFKSTEDRKRVQEIEQLRRKGHNFIRVRYVGRVVPAVDSEGVVYNIRLHGLRDVEAFEKTDINTGRTDWDSRPGAKALTFRMSPSGDIEADIWDDPDLYNRHFISTHPELEVSDSRLAEDIKRLVGKPFKVELTDEEVLEREILAKQRELDNLKKAKGQRPQGVTIENSEEVAEESAQKETEEITENVTQKPHSNRGRKKGSKDKRPRVRRIDGVNKSTPGVDSSGVPRVATGGGTEGDSTPVQSSAPDSQYGGAGPEPTL